MSETATSPSVRPPARTFSSRRAFVWLTGHSTPTELRLSDTTATLHRAATALGCVAYLDVERPEVVKRWYWPWARLDIRSQFSGSISLRGLPLAEAEAACAAIAQRRRDALRAALDRYGPQLRRLDARVKDFARAHAWVPDSQVQAVRETAIKVLEPAADLVGRLGDDAAAEAELVRAIRAFAEDHRGFADRVNERFTRVALTEHASLFDTLLPKPLTEAQRRAVVTDEDATLVLAGAGTGKTGVIVAKIVFLTRVLRLPAPQILVLTFGKEAAAEIRDRLDALGVRGVEVRTFHALGYAVLKGLRRSANWPDQGTDVSELAQAEEKLLAHLTASLETLYKDECYRGLIDRWFRSHFTDEKSILDFKTEGEYWHYVRSHHIVSLAGHRVRSFEECEISNFLYLHGIEHDYEKPYDKDVSAPGYATYRPDFYLRDHGIWIEHYGVARDGSTAPHIDQRRYHESMVWKKQIHAKYNPDNYVETFSYQRKEGRLFSVLRSELETRGVRFRPLPAADMFARLKGDSHVNGLAKLIAKFMGLYRADGLTPDDVRLRAIGRIAPERAEAFLAVFLPVLQVYETRLRSAGEIDFADMVARPTRLLERDEPDPLKRTYARVLVDEFQDLAPSRARLLQAFRAKVGNPRLFCVGDDWQSIFRFTGSDPGVVQDFARQFGFTKDRVLDRTFRFNDAIARVSRAFIMRNVRGQRDKEISAGRKVDGPAVFTYREARGEVVALERVLNRLSRGVANGTATVFLLGRAKGLRTPELQALERSCSNLKVEFKTVHASKGLEADHVVVLGCTSGTFPSRVHTDTVQELVLPPSDAFPDAEERRLFYVALTRARHSVHLIADRDQPSPFVLELEAGGDKAVLPVDGQEQRSLCCPSCKTGVLLPDRGGSLGCSNAPFCKGRGVRCSCGVGYIGLIAGTNRLACTVPDCEHQHSACTACGRGVLVARRNRSTAQTFLSCSRFPACRGPRTVLPSRVLTRRSRRR